MRRRQPRSTRTANLLPYTTLCRADALMSGKNKKGGCGARLGCWTCQQANDKSLETMIQFEPRYEYAKGLNQLNKFIRAIRSEEHTSELQSLMRISYAVFCLKKKPNTKNITIHKNTTTCQVQI